MFSDERHEFRLIAFSGRMLIVRLLKSSSAKSQPNTVLYYTISYNHLRKDYFYSTESRSSISQLGCTDQASCRVYRQSSSSRGSERTASGESRQSLVGSAGEQGSLCFILLSLREGCASQREKNSLTQLYT